MNMRTAALIMATVCGCWLGLAARGMGSAPATYGQLRVTSQPVGAEVVFDGQPQEVTPVTVTHIAPGTHLLLVRKEGYIESRRAIALLAGVLLNNLSK